MSLQLPCKMDNFLAKPLVKYSLDFLLASVRALGLDQEINIIIGKLARIHFAPMFKN